MTNPIRGPLLVGTFVYHVADPGGRGLLLDVGKYWATVYWPNSTIRIRVHPRDNIFPWFGG